MNIQESNRRTREAQAEFVCPACGWRGCFLARIIAEHRVNPTALCLGGCFAKRHPMPISSDCAWIERRDNNYFVNDPESNACAQETYWDNLLRHEEALQNDPI